MSIRDEARAALAEALLREGRSDVTEDAEAILSALNEIGFAVAREPRPSESKSTEPLVRSKLLRRMAENADKDRQGRQTWLVDGPKAVLAALNATPVPAEPTREEGLTGSASRMDDPNIVSVYRAEPAIPTEGLRIDASCADGEPIHGLYRADGSDATIADLRALLSATDTASTPGLRDALVEALWPEFREPGPGNDDTRTARQKAEEYAARIAPRLRAALASTPEPQQRRCVVCGNTRRDCRHSFEVFVGTPEPQQPGIDAAIRVLHAFRHPDYAGTVGNGVCDCVVVARNLLRLTTEASR